MMKIYILNNNKKNLPERKKEGEEIKGKLSEDIEYEQEVINRIIPNIHKPELITDIPDDKREVYIEDEDKENEMMIGGGEFMENEDKENEMMIGGGEFMENELENEMMIGGGEFMENEFENEMMIGGGEIIEPIIEPKEEKDKRYKYNVAKTLEERPRNVLLTEEKEEDDEKTDMNEIELSPNHINSPIPNIKSKISNEKLIPVEQEDKKQKQEISKALEERPRYINFSTEENLDKNYENVIDDNEKHNIPLTNENKIMEDLEKIIDDDKTEKTIEQQPVETFESSITKEHEDPCCLNALRGWLFIKINAYVVYQINNRIIRKRFEHWKKYSKIENKGNDEINTPFQH